MNRNCKLCSHYQCEEIGDSDYGAIYADKPTCEEFNDCDDNENLIPNFDREIQRECCILDFWKVLEVDNELEKLIIDKEEETNWDKAYKRFREKYIDNK